MENFSYNFFEFCLNHLNDNAILNGIKSSQGHTSQRRINPKIKVNTNHKREKQKSKSYDEKLSKKQKKNIFKTKSSYLNGMFCVSFFLIFQFG